MLTFFAREGTPSLRQEHYLAALRRQVACAVSKDASKTLGDYLLFRDVWKPREPDAGSNRYSDVDKSLIQTLMQRPRK